MRTYAGIVMLLLATSFAAYEIISGSVSLSTGAGVLAMTVSGGIIIRRGKRKWSEPWEDVRDADIRDTVIPPNPKVPSLPAFMPVSPDASATPADPPSSRSRIDGRHGTMLPPSDTPQPVRTKSGLTLVVSDGQRADVRDYRLRTAR